MPLRRQLTEEQVLQKMASLCSVAEHCESEIVEKMNRMGVERNVAERIVDRLVDEGFIDEQRYCRAFVHDKLFYNGWGRLKIKAMLAQKRIDRKIVGEALDEIESKEYNGVMKQVIESKRRTLAGVEGYELQAKLVRFAVGRGFEPSLVCRCLNTEDIDEIQIT